MADASLLAAALTPAGRKPPLWEWQPNLLSGEAHSIFKKGCLGVYPFLEGAGPPRNVLPGGNWPDATLQGSPGWIATRAGPAVETDGNTNYVDFGANFGSTSQYSYLIVTQLGQSGAGDRRFIAGQLDQSSGYDLGGPYFNTDGTATFYFRNGSNTGNSTTAWTIAGQIVAFACLYDDDVNRAELWADGVLEASTSGSGAITATNSFTIGQNWQGLNNRDNSPLLFVPFTRALTQGEAAWVTRNWQALIAPAPAKVLPRFFVPAAAGGATGSIADGFGLTDVVSARAVLGASQTDGLGLDDSATASATLLAVIADALGLDDTAAGAAALQAAVAEGLGLSDTFGATAQLLASAADGLGLGDTATTGALIAASIAETLALDDSPATILTISAALAEAFGLSDALLARSVLVADLLDGLGLDDSPAVLAQLSAVIGETIALGDVIAFVEESTDPGPGRTITVSGAGRVISVGGENRAIIVPAKGGTITVKE